MILKIFIDPHPILHQKTAPVASADLPTAEFKKFIADMKETMRAKDGVGLAAPQVGQGVAVCVIHAKYARGEESDADLVLINPTWEKITRKKEFDDEGCLSLPGIFGKVKRYKNIRVRALDEKNQAIDFLANDFFARIIQHETDHLQGVLFTEKAKNIRQINEI